MQLPDETLDFLEKGIPALAQAAVTIARWEALAAGLSVVEVQAGNLVEVFPNGAVRVIKPIEPGPTISKGTRFTLAHDSQSPSTVAPEAV